MIAGALALFGRASGWFSTAKLVAIVLAVAAAGGGLLYVKALRADVARLQTERQAIAGALAEAVATNDANLAAMAALQAHANRTVETLSRERDALARRAARVRVLYREIEHAPTTDDGPVAPVLRRALERLRETGPAPAGDPGGGPPRGGAGRPARLPGGAGPAGG